MRTLFLRLVLLAFCLVSSRFLLAQVSAQTASAASETTHAPDPDSGMTGHVNGLFIPLVADQPFHAKIAVEINRLLPDGATVAQKYYTLAARDGTGREYREARDLVPADSDLEPALVRTIVYNPKTSVITTCTPDQRICRQMTFDSTQHPVEEPAGPSPDGKSVLTRESLGTKTIDGLQATGTRETLTFNPGAFGNDKPVVVTKEIWYSPQLQFNLSVTRNDPRNGTQKLDVVDLKLGDPGESWFVIPDGYRLVTGRGMPGRPMYPAELQPLIEKSVSGMSSDELATALQPVEAAIGAYAKAHAAASPNDNIEAFAGQLRMRLSSDLRFVQMSSFPSRMTGQAGPRLEQTYQQVLTSPCLNKSDPGDPPSMPSSADTLRAEQTAWVALRDAWITFLAKLFPNADPSGFAWQLTNERDSELRRVANVERMRGCMPEESIQPLIENFVSGMTPAELSTALKPVDAAILDYAKAHAASEPKEQNENFVRQLDQQLSSELMIQQRNRVPTQDQFEEADLHLNQAFRAVISSPCLSKTIPGDPPSAPVSEEKLRAEERAWIAMRDAWTAFMVAAFPGTDRQAFGTMLTDQRTFELRQIQNIERNRGCTPVE